MTQQLRAQRAVPVWSLGTAPVLSIGEDGTAATEFLRITGTFRISGGLIAVVNAGTNEIRVFDAQGSPVSTFGRPGSGPGEFRSIGWAGRSGDTLFVFDASLRRLTTLLLGRAPRLLVDKPVVARADQMYGIVGRVADGRWLVGSFIRPPGWNVPQGVYRMTGFFGMIGSDAGGKVDWLAEFPSGGIFLYKPSTDLRRASSSPIPFTPWHYGVASGRHLWLGESGSDSLIRVDSRDAKRVAVRLPFPPREPGRSLIASMRATRLATARNKDDSASVNLKFSSKNLPRNLPFFDGLFPGPGGELWVQGYAANSADAARYLVVGPDGSIRAWVNVPAGFRIKEVGPDYLLGLRVDEDGVESVHMYRLSRN